MKLNEKHCITAIGIVLCFDNLFRENKLFQRGWRVLSEIPSVVGYGYFLEPHIVIFVLNLYVSCQTL